MALDTRRPSRERERLMRNLATLKEPAKRLNAVVSPELYRRIKTQCAQEEITISELTRRLWENYLARKDTRGE